MNDEKTKGGKNMDYNFGKIVGNFAVEGKLLRCERYGEGHINET